MAAALRHGAFRRLASLYAANCLTEWFGSVALMVLVYDATKSATAATAMLLCKQVIPGLVTSMSGRTLDRLPLAGAMSAALALQVVALLGLAVVGYGTALFALVAVLGTAGAIFRASLRAGVSRALPAPDFRGGNALLNIFSSVSMAAGPALAAAAVVVLDPQAALLGGAALLALSLVPAMLPWHGAFAEAPVAESGDEDPLDTRAVSGLPLRVVLALAAVVMCVVAMDEPALLAYAEESLGAGVGGYGAIYAAWGVGLAIGGVAFARLTQAPMLRVAAWATVLGAVGYLGLGVAPTIAVAAVVAVVGGIGNGLGWVALVTAVQEAAPRGHEARVATRLEAMALICPAIGILLGGILADASGPRLSLLLPGFLALAVVAFGVLFARARRTRRPAVAAAPATGFLSPSTPGGSA